MDLLLFWMTCCINGGLLICFCYLLAIFVKPHAIERPPHRYWDIILKFVEWHDTVVKEVHDSYLNIMIHSNSGAFVGWFCGSDLCDHLDEQHGDHMIMVCGFDLFHIHVHLLVQY